jgi:Uma2 family endonuclease
MASVISTRATLDDLARVEGKAELIGGRIVNLMATGHYPNQVAGRIYIDLFGHARRIGKGNAYTDNMGFAVPELPGGRESFSPDVSYWAGIVPTKWMKFIKGAPTFAAEVRSENDYGEAAEAEMADKRADYFAAGTQVVWDVDPVPECVHVYRADNPARATTYRRGEVAEAEPALPGWRLAVDEIFSE